MFQMILGAVMLSTSAPWVKLADVNPTAVGFYRMVLGGLALLFVSWSWNKKLWTDKTYFLTFAPVALFFAMDLFMWHRSIRFVGPGLATILVNLQVFVMASVGAMWYREKLGWKFAAGLLLAFPGVLILVGIDWSALSDNYLLGVGLGIGSALAYSGFLLGMRAAGQRGNTLSAPVNLMYATFWCAVFLGLLTLGEGGSFDIPDLESLGAIFAYGIVCQVVGWILITRAMPSLPTAIVGLILLLQPALAMVWDLLFFGRPTSLTDGAGVVLVLSGIYLASIRDK